MSLPLILRIFKNNQIKEVKQFHLDQIVIGQNAEVDLDLADSQVSAIHAMIEKRNDRYFICDLGSQTGTYKNGIQILDEPIDSGDQIQIGEYTLHFNVGIPKPKTKAPEVSTAFEEMAPGLPKESPFEFKTNFKTDSHNSENSKPILNSPSEVKKSTISKHSEKKYEIEKTSFSYENILSKKTFAPPSVNKDLNQIFKPSRGTVLEISISWKERVLETYHFSAQTTKVVIGSSKKSQIQLPANILSGGEYTLVESLNSSGAIVNVRPDMSGDLVTQTGILSLADLDKRSRLNRRGATSQIKIDQGEVLRLCLSGDDINIFIRYIPQSKKPNLLPFIPLTVGEIGSVLVAIGLVGFLFLYISVKTVIEEKPKEEEQIRIAQIIYKVPDMPKPVMPVEKPPVQPPPPPPVEKPPVKVPPKVVDLGKKTVNSQVGQNTPKTSNITAPKPNHVAAGKNSPGQAADVRPNKNLNKPKTFTSSKQGGAIKLGQQAGSSGSQTTKPVDPSQFGLASALTGGGMRSKLDQAVSGAGDIIGDSNKATGTVGFGANRAGDDFGSQFKDTGAGGKGTATEGIAGGITKGRSTGTGTYGSNGSGLGDHRGIEVSSPGFSAFNGTIDREAVLRVIKSHHPDIVRCYEKELRFKADLGGKVTVNFLIDDQGRAKNVSIKGSTIEDTSVESCIVNEYQSWRFPEAPSGDVANVSFPYTFTKKK